MKPKSLKEIQNSKIVRRRLAEMIARECFRESDILENLHSGTFPSSEKEDYSDVKVVSPYGKIPWSRFGRFSDAELQVLMTEVGKRCQDFVEEFFTSSATDRLIEQLKVRNPYPPNWRKIIERNNKRRARKNKS